MGSLRNKDRILEAIDQLRRRKARPDINRICNYLFRRYSVNFSDARADLQSCVDNGAVLKVEYKGSTSYRNASKKFSHLKRVSSDDNSAPDIHKVNRKFSQLLTNAFGELIVEEPDYLEFGVPAPVITSTILSKDSVRYTKKYVSILLDKEVESGSLIRMENGNYQMGPVSEEGRKMYESNRDSSDISLTLANLETDGHIKKIFPIIHLKPRKKPGPKPGFKSKYIDSCENSMDSDEKKSETGVVSRTGGRQKRAKKVFDPSDSHVPKKRGRPAGSLNKATIEKQLIKIGPNEEPRPDSRTSSNGRDQGGVCSVCHLQNKKGPSDRMVSCRECSNKAHQSCLKGDDMMLKMYPDNTWQCPHCKTCVICYETSDAGFLNVCSVCADGYHSACHQPVITEKIKNGTKWLCINCQMPEELEVHEIESNIGNSFRITQNNQSPRSGNSGNSTPTNYNSSHSSPAAPNLSPQRSSNASRHRSPSPAMSDSQSKDSDFDENIDPSIPDATHWTYEEVYQYFAQYFPEEAKVFREQEIDGRSLLLMKRLDVLTNLKLKLGPALKIYRHVVKLQVRRDDPKLYFL